jgi:CDP-4-dehydro-6-deoxyglucose reductase, E1
LKRAPSEPAEAQRKAFVDAGSEKILDVVRGKPAPSRVPYAGLVFDRSEVEETLGAVFDAFTSGWFALGKCGALFEERLAKLIGADGSVLTNSGSSANLLAVATLVHLKKLHAGDEVLTPATTFPTTINPLLLYGLKPVLVDVDIPSFTVSAEKLKRSASAKTKGVMLPHLNGSASFMPEIAELSKSQGWVLLEDCCDALGTTVGGKPVGSYGDVATFSFYAAHHIGMGEGGAVVSRSKEVVDTARSLRDWGRASGEKVFDMAKGRVAQKVGAGSSLPDDYETRFTYVTKGFNLKPLDIQAAMGIAQLEKLPRFTEARKRNHRRLYQTLLPYERNLWLPKALPGVEASWFVFPIVVKEDAPFHRADLVGFLESNGIETRPILAGNITKQPAYSEIEFVVRSALSQSDLILRNGFFVGLFPGLREEQIAKIESGFQAFFQRFAGS